MTPVELETLIRQRYNAVGDNFWSSEEIQGLIWGACFEMAREALMIERVYTTLSVNGTNEIPYPTNTIAIKRITYDGQKLQPISFREDDQLTSMNQNSQQLGTPLYYAVWDETLYLRPIPDTDDLTIKIFSINEPQEITTTSTLEVPTQFHIDIVDYVLSAMHAKEKNFEGSGYYRTEWEKRLARMKAWSRKRLRTDGFSSVVDIDSVAESFLGTV